MLLNLTNISFTADDIKDKNLLNVLIEEEANRIFKSSAANRGRSYEEIYEACKIGKIAECWLYENRDLKFTDSIHTDLINENHEVIEVKVKTSSESKLKIAIYNDIERILNESWNDSTYYICFILKDNIYKFECIKKIR